MAATSRADLQALALGRLADARLLSRRGRDSSAYYLAGYAVEFALKAAIVRKIERHVLPDPAFIRDVYQYNLERLVIVADLGVELDLARRGSSRFNANWTIVRKWNVDSRYEVIDRQRSVTMIKAVSDSSAGVLSWVRKHW